MRFKYIIFFLLITFSTCLFANPQLKTMNLKQTDNGTQICLGFSELMADPMAFSTDHPARIILDFPDSSIGLSRAASKIISESGIVKRIRALCLEKKTRVIIDLQKSVVYELKRENNTVYVLIPCNAIPNNKRALAPLAGSSQVQNTVKELAFKPGDNGEAQLLIGLSGAQTPVDLTEENNQVILRFMNTRIAERLAQALDVTQFGTPVTSINTSIEGKNVVVRVKFKGATENRVYQADDRFTLEVRPIAPKSDEKEKSVPKNTTEYTGERLSLNFQDIEVRAVLQLIADFTGLNIVTSDSVTGNVTLRLRNVPWDQALAIILKSKGLEKRQVGNVLWVGPSEEIAAREKLELQAQQQVEELAPLRSDYIQIVYAKAVNIAMLLKGEKSSLLSSRGSVSVDDRTNILLVQDTAKKIAEIRKLIKHLDVPVRQVLIEARVVLAHDDFEDAIGVQFGGASALGTRPRLGVAGVVPNGSNDIALGADPGTIAPANRLAVNLPELLSNGSTYGQIAMTLAKLPGGTILDLELMALETEGLGKIVSSPRLVTADQNLAYIESGEEIPYNESTSSGAAAIAFKKAVLRLEVTPQITPDDHIVLNLKVNQDSRGTPTINGLAINTREMQTKVLVANGETIVLGGIYEQTKSKKVTRVPILGYLPVIGFLFRSEHNFDLRKELMIFVTPKIIKEGATC